MLTSKLAILFLLGSLIGTLAKSKKAARSRKRACGAQDPNDPRKHHPWAGHYSRTTGIVAGSSLAPEQPFATDMTVLRSSVTVTTEVTSGSVTTAAKSESYTLTTSGAQSMATSIISTTTSVSANRPETIVPEITSVPPIPVIPGAPQVTQVEEVAPVKTDAPAAVNNGGGQVGLSVDWQSNCKGASFGSKISWYYSWTLQTWPGMEGIEFVPMVKNRPTAEAFKPEQLGKAQYALSINEPDIAGQHDGAIIPAPEVVRLHKLWTAQVPANVKIGSIAVSNGGAKYWADWTAACAGTCRYDFIPIHYYGLTAAGFIDYAKTYAKEGKPLWVTEIACREYTDRGINGCSIEDTRKMMKESIAWMRGEGASLVHRWTWFGAWSVGFGPEGDSEGFNLLDPGGNANELGKLFASL